jgi:hypothetical protein
MEDFLKISLPLPALIATDVRPCFIPHTHTHTTPADGVIVIV